MENFIELENKMLKVQLNEDTMIFNVLKKSSNKKWEQTRVFNDLKLLNYTKEDNELYMNVLLEEWKYTFDVIITINDKINSELIIEIKNDNGLKNFVYPYPFIDGECELILPLNQGLIWNSNESILPEVDFPLFSGLNVTMPFYSMLSGKNTLLAITETPNDAYIRSEVIDGKSILYTKWGSRVNNVNSRKVKYVFIDDSNIVKMSKEVRKYMIETGNFKGLKDKLSKKQMEILAGSAQIWSNSDMDKNIIQEMTQKEVQKLIWNNTQNKIDSEFIQTWNYLPAIYENYNDAISPENEKLLESHFENTLRNVWSQKIILGDGTWKKGVHIIDNEKNYDFYLGLLCDKFIPEYIDNQNKRKYLSNKVKISRYVDNLVSIELNECYNAEHTMNRDQCMEYRIMALNNLSQGKSVIGMESGIYYAARYVHYFLGMMSIYQFIDFESDNIFKISDNYSKEYKDIYLNYKHQIPLWELIYHDNVLTSWYPGDGNNNILDLWTKKDLYNILYGTQPLYVITDEYWESYKNNIISSIKKVTESTKNSFNVEMINFEYLTNDKSVQKTEFSNGYHVIVNFGKENYIIEENIIVPPNGFYESKIDIVSDNISEENKRDKDSNGLIHIVFGGVIIIISITLVIITTKRKK